MKFKIIKQTAFLSVLLMLLWSVGDAQEFQRKGIFYSIAGNGLRDTSYLFGTYHLVKGSYLEEIPAVVNAFNKSNGLIVEIIMDSSQLTLANSMALMQNRQLTQLIDQGFADSLDTELKATLGQGIDKFNSFKPMTIMVTLALVYVMKDNQPLLNKYTGSPLDLALFERSKLSGKRATALETITQQMDLLFNSYSDEQQAVMLRRFLRNKAANISMGNNLLKTYFSNDLEAILSIYKASLAETGEDDVFAKQRNQNWMKTLPGLLKKESQFIAVGALHLAGPEGLVELLQKQGYSVKPVKLQ